MTHHIGGRVQYTPAFVKHKARHGDAWGRHFAAMRGTIIAEPRGYRQWLVQWDDDTTEEQRAKLHAYGMGEYENDITEAAP